MVLGAQGKRQLDIRFDVDITKVQHDDDSSCRKELQVSVRIILLMCRQSVMMVRGAQGKG